MGFERHSGKVARLGLRAQGDCASARRARRCRGAVYPIALALAAGLAGGCARVPVAASGAEARARFLEAHAAPPAPTRGVGTIEARVAGRGGSFEARWGSLGDSLVVVGYAGPVRAVDASLLGDSIFLAIRPRELGVAGLVRSEEGLGADGVRFLLRPWDFSATWIREALERAAVDPIEDGWRLRGEGRTEAGGVTVTLDLSRRGEPRRLTLARDGESRFTGDVRYGALRRYAAGRVPRWVEWTREDARVRLDVRDVDPLPGGVLRRLPPAPPEWRVVSLNDPEGRRILGRLLGSREEASP